MGTIAFLPTQGRNSPVTCTIRGSSPRPTLKRRGIAQIGGARGLPRSVSPLSVHLGARPDPRGSEGFDAGLDIGADGIRHHLGRRRLGELLESETVDAWPSPPLEFQKRHRARPRRARQRGSIWIVAVIPATS